jgi:hypothetical protein
MSKKFIISHVGNIVFGPFKKMEFISKISKIYTSVGIG